MLPFAAPLAYWHWHAAATRRARSTKTSTAPRHRIGEQFELFADRASSATVPANQLRMWFSAMAYVLVDSLRRVGLRHTQFADAGSSCSSSESAAACAASTSRSHQAARTRSNSRVTSFATTS
jgi:hypothetical protein